MFFGSEGSGYPRFCEVLTVTYFSELNCTAVLAPGRTTKKQVLGTSIGSSITFLVGDINHHSNKPHMSENFNRVPNPMHAMNRRP